MGKVRPSAKKVAAVEKKLPPHEHQATHGNKIVTVWPVDNGKRRVRVQEVGKPSNVIDHFYPGYVDAETAASRAAKAVKFGAPSGPG